MSSLGDTFITIFGIVLAAILMFGFPLMSMSDRTDDIVTMTAQTATTEYVDNVRATGKVTMDNYSSFEQRLAATGNAYDIEMEVKILDENPGKKTTQANYTKIGENVYYSMYTSQILDSMNANGGVLTLKEGDMFSTSVKNTNTTLSQQLKNFFYAVAGNDTYAIAAQHGGYVTANGSGE